MSLSIRQILAHQGYAFPKLLAFRIQMVLSYQMTMVAIGWHIYEITHDPWALGLIGLAEVIPYMGSALFAGHAVDHYFSRRGFACLSAVFLAFNALLLVWIALTQPAHTDWWIYGTVALTGFARAFIAPSYNTLFALIIPRASIAKASGIGSSMFQIGLIVGPAIGGLLIGFADKSVAYGLSAALALGAAIAAMSVRVTQQRSHAPLKVFASIAEGLRFVKRTQVVLGAQLLDMFAVLFGGTVAMLPAFVHDIYQMGPEGLGILRAAPAVGAIVTGVWLAKHPLHQHSGRWLLLAVAGFGLCMIAFGLCHTFWLAIVILAISGMLDGVSVVLRQTILQLATPDNMRGRVSAINGIFIGSSNELGAFESGLTARLMGLVPSVVFGGCMTLAVVGVTAIKAPELRELHISQLH
ncbi:MFS transporter [Methylophilus aquaticus]|uniref:MFS transporter n=1 Tax=Methylophilus aquaticus TaxID=1971610 RepID=A0ABT9JTQ2_9PROT|nr:MFS transporter [Methylophilus aquaticus]MDP8567834.1 MFS transporter [Methylophilus aquaticus]